MIYSYNTRDWPVEPAYRREERIIAELVIQKARELTEAGLGGVRFTCALNDRPKRDGQT